MNLPRGWGEARFGASSWRWSVRPVPEYRSRESAAAECLLRGACVLHAEPERRALLRRAEHVRGLDVDPVLAEAIRGPGERARFVREPYFDDLAVARDAVLLRLDRAASLRDRKSTRLNSSHITISYAVFCL